MFTSICVLRSQCISCWRAGSQRHPKDSCTAPRVVFPQNLPRPVYTAPCPSTRMCPLAAALCLLHCLARSTPLTAAAPAPSARKSWSPTHAPAAHCPPRLPRLPRRHGCAYPPEALQCRPWPSAPLPHPPAHAGLRVRGCLCTTHMCTCGNEGEGEGEGGAWLCTVTCVILAQGLCSALRATGALSAHTDAAGMCVASKRVQPFPTHSLDGWMCIRAHAWDAYHMYVSCISGTNMHLWDAHHMYVSCMSGTNMHLWDARHMYVSCISGTNMHLWDAHHRYVHACLGRTCICGMHTICTFHACLGRTCICGMHIICTFHACLGRTCICGMHIIGTFHACLGRTCICGMHIICAFHACLGRTSICGMHIICAFQASLRRTCICGTNMHLWDAHACTPWAHMLACLGHRDLREAMGQVWVKDTQET